MKKIFKLGIAGLLFAFVFTALTGLGAVKASADTLSEDLDGDGTKESIEWESGDINSLTINGKGVVKASKIKLKENEYGEYYISVIDTATKDKYKEVVIRNNYLEELSELFVIRYDNGKISKYAYFEDFDGVVSQKTKGRIKIQTYVFVHGIGNVRIDLVYKIKKGKATLATKTYKPNKENTTSFKSTKEPIIFTSTEWTEEAGVLKNGEKFTLVEFAKDENGEFTQVYIKTKSGVKGWINTSDYDYSTFIPKNPPLWD